MSPKKLPIWKQLESQAEYLLTQNINQLFTESSERFKQLNFVYDGLLLDLSKQRLTPEVLANLIKLAESCNLKQKIDDLYSGKPVNDSENRAALHTALRSPATERLIVNKNNVIKDVHSALNKMEKIVNQIHSGQWRGVTGHPINTIVNIGVGGSDLGPMMSCRALAGFQSGAAQAINIHFVSSMDGSQLSTLLNNLDPARTLFVISSKSFSTVDTLANASTARKWLKRSITGVSKKSLIACHFIAISANPKKTNKWGIPDNNRLDFQEWVGGRYSMWSCIGFSIAIKIGMDNFHQMLAGAHQMDLHFKQAPFKQNLAVLLAMTSIWNINFLNIKAHAILPYDGRLKHLPAYLEQLEMESNGKSVNFGGQPVDYHTCPVIWGEVGTNAQHAFYQLLHQGTQSVMCDFIAASNRYKPNDPDLFHQQQLNLANCLAQSRILALGDSVIENADSAPAHKRYHGNQPCTTLLIDELTPFSFGQLIALYEHKVFAQSVIWDINPFDQWGVELGKQMATLLLDTLASNTDEQHFDASTRGLLQRISNTE